MFNIFLAGSRNPVDEISKEIGMNRLGSQIGERHILEDYMKYRHENNTATKLLIDSGAYSIHRSGAEVNLQDYIDYLNDHVGEFEGIAQLDEIPGKLGKPKTLKDYEVAAEKSWENYQYMVTKVIDYKKVMPIFHQGDPIKYLHLMLSYKHPDGTHIEYIGISPANDQPINSKNRWLDKVFNIIKKSENPNVKTHGFGYTSLKHLQRYPFYSADSTSWLMTAANGSIITKWGTIPASEMTKGDTNHVCHLIGEERKEFLAECERYGITEEQLATEYLKRMEWNVKYLKEWSESYEYKPSNHTQKTLF